MNLDSKLENLPMTKTNPVTLATLFRREDIEPMWVPDMEFEIDQATQEALIKRITNSGFGYEYKTESLIEVQKAWYKNHYGISLIATTLFIARALQLVLQLLLKILLPIKRVLLFSHLFLWNLKM